MFVLKIISAVILSVLALNVLIILTITVCHGLRAKSGKKINYLGYTLILLSLLAILICPVLYFCGILSMFFISIAAMILLACFLFTVCVIIFIRSGFLYGLLSLLILLIPIVPLFCILF